MIALHEIGELDRRGVTIRLTPRERSALSRVADRLGVEWQPDGARVFSVGYVGSVVLSPDTVITVTTKVPISNVLALAGLAYQTLALPSAVGETLLDAVQPGGDWLTVLLVIEIEALTARAVRRDYVTVDDHLPYVRGRLRFDTSALSARPGITPCEFTDFVPDIPENQILKGCLEMLASQPLLPGLRPRVEQLLRVFTNITLVRPSERLVDACRVSRLNRQYGPALQLCRLFLAQAGVALDAGAIAAPAFFFPLPVVFQEAVTSLLRRRLPDVSRQVTAFHESTAGTPSRRLRFAPDIVVGSPPQLVIDTKYAAPELQNQYGSWSFRNDDIYQAMFYALSLGCPGLLIYPRSDRDVNITFNVEGVSVSILTVDLSQPGMGALEDLASAVANLADRVGAAGRHSSCDPLAGVQR